LRLRARQVTVWSARLGELHSVRYGPEPRIDRVVQRALAARPDFILLDEPLAGIDPIAVGDIRALISHL